MSTTRRIVDPHYGMVVTDGIAARVWMLIRPTGNIWLAHGDDRLLWEAQRIDASGSTSYGRVFLSPSGWGEVVE